MKHILRKMARGIKTIYAIRKLTPTKTIDTCPKCPSIKSLALLSFLRNSLTGHYEQPFLDRNLNLFKILNAVGIYYP